jgi:hypothetical protein
MNNGNRRNQNRTIVLYAYYKQMHFSTEEKTNPQFGGRRSPDVKQTINKSPKLFKDVFKSVSTCHSMEYMSSYESSFYI